MTAFVTIGYAARQYRIPCTPGKILNEVLEEGKQRAGVVEGSWTLRYGKTNLDLSLPMRLARLPNGAKIDLVKSSTSAEATVNVALNVIGSARRTATVNARGTLWEVLAAFEDDITKTISAIGLGNDGRVYRRQCIVNLNNKEYASDEELKRITLQSLGIVNGSAVIRLSFGAPEQLAIEPTTSTPVVSSTIEESRQTTTFSKPDPISAPTTTNISTLSQTKRKIEVLAPSNSPTPFHAHLDSQDDDFKISIDQAKSYQASLGQRSRASQAPLTTQAYRQAQAEERRLLTKPDICRVKTKFPDGVQVVSDFQPDETAQDLYGFIDGVLAGHVRYDLGIAGQKTKLSRDKQQLWRDLQFTKAVVIYVIVEPGESAVVKPQYKAMAKDVSSVLAQHSERETSSIPSTDLKQAISSTEPEDPPKEKKMPTWLQKSLGKK